MTSSDNAKDMATAKQKLRRQMREAKLQCTEAERQAWSGRVVDALVADPHLRSAQTVLLYHPLPDEVDIRPLLDRFSAQGKTVLLPRVTSADGGMELRRYTGADDLRRGAFGIMEPCGEVFLDYEAIGVAIVPGMAFDRRGNRLGRGLGYYDRLLPLLPNAHKLGVCFGFQFVEQVPAQMHDVRMDAVPLLR